MYPLDPLSQQKTGALRAKQWCIRNAMRREQDFHILHITSDGNSCYISLIFFRFCEIKSIFEYTISEQWQQSKCTTIDCIYYYNVIMLL